MTVIFHKVYSWQDLSLHSEFGPSFYDRFCWLNWRNGQVRSIAWSGMTNVTHVDEWNISAGHHWIKSLRPTKVISILKYNLNHLSLLEYITDTIEISLPCFLQGFVVSIASGKGFVAKWLGVYIQQSITCTVDDPFYWRMYASQYPMS